MKAKREPMSQEQYLAEGGNVCPWCGSADVQGDAIEVDGNEALQDVSCNACHASWQDLYKLAGYAKLND